MAIFLLRPTRWHAECTRPARRWIHEDLARGAFDVVFAEWFALPLAIPHCQKCFWRVKGPRFFARQCEVANDRENVSSVRGPWWNVKFEIRSTKFETNTNSRNSNVQDGCRGTVLARMFALLSI